MNTEETGAALDSKYPKPNESTFGKFYWFRPVATSTANDKLTTFLVGLFMTPGTEDALNF